MKNSEEKRRERRFVTLSVQCVCSVCAVCVQCVFVPLSASVFCGYMYGHLACLNSRQNIYQPRSCTLFSHVLYLTPRTLFTSHSFTHATSLCTTSPQDSCFTASVPTRRPSDVSVPPRIDLLPPATTAIRSYTNSSTSVDRARILRKGPCIFVHIRFIRLHLFRNIFEFGIYIHILTLFY